MSMPEYSGAWLTDIDDTLIESGETPDKEWIKWLAGKIEILKQHNILWIPMSGVALVKLGPRILFRLPKEVLSHVLYYGGDGSQKFLFNDNDERWEEDHKFQTVFSSSQGIAILGYEEYKNALEDIYQNSESSEAIIQKILDEGMALLSEKNIAINNGLLDELKQILSNEGYDPGQSELYFRGGSVSWMIFGDISAEPYKEVKAVRVRKKIMEYAAEWLMKHDGLSSLGERPISIPFPGARGIKFVLVGNDKEKATRDIVETEGIDPHKILFVGNEIFAGGNDNMIRNIEDVSLLSVGEKTDEGRNVVFGGIGVEANKRWMESLCDELQAGASWVELLNKM
jgi:hypothetical protein